MSESRQFISRDEAAPPFFVGVDLGGTNIKVGVVDDRGRSLTRQSVPTHSDRGPEDGARRMGEAVLQALSTAGVDRSHVGRVGLGTPGTMDIPAGMMLQPHNLPGWEDFPVRDRVSHHCSFPVSYANDAGSAAFGEFWVGSGEAFDSMVMLTLGTGIGGGIIVNGRSIDGQHSHGAECGHIIIDMAPDARVCPCGQPGHLEGYASAVAIVRRAEEALETGRDSLLRSRVAAGEKITPLLLNELAEQGDELSLEIIMQTAEYLGVGIVTLMHTIDPDGVVLGGAMTFGGHTTKLGRRFLARVQEEVHSRAFPVLRDSTAIDFARLGGDAGYIGAAGIARADYHR